jgi:hypothetical protein
VASGDLHLRIATGNPAIDRGVELDPGVCDDDADGDLRDSAPDIGADEL